MKLHKQKKLLRCQNVYPTGKQPKNDYINGTTILTEQRSLKIILYAAETMWSLEIDRISGGTAPTFGVRS